MKAILYILPVIMFMASSCSYDYAVPREVNPDDTVSFSLQIIPIFNSSCNMSGCHESGGVLPDLTPANAYMNLTLMEYVNLDQPSLSLLYSVMDDMSNPMPPEGRLSDDKVKLILYWIQQGALDN